MNVTMLLLANIFARQQSELGPLSDTSVLPFDKQGLLTIFADFAANAFSHSLGLGLHLVFTLNLATTTALRAVLSPNNKH